MSTSQSIPSQTLITFIVPVYNLPLHLIKECIESIIHLPLSRNEKEVIIVDDGSGSSPIPELDKCYSDLVCIRQTNQGLSAARNSGIERANGKYIQFVDGDDCLITKTYEALICFIKEQDADMVLFPHSKDKRAKSIPHLNGPVTGVGYMCRHNLRAAAWGYLFKKDILGSLRFTCNLINEDEAFTPLLLLRAKKVFYTESAAYFYRQRENSIMNDLCEQSISRRLTDTQNIILFLHRSAQMQSEGEHLALGRRVAQLSMDYLYNVIRLTHSMSKFNEALQILREHQIFPLSPINYTMKYTWFRKMLNTVVGRWLLFFGITALSKWSK